MFTARSHAQAAKQARKHFTRGTHRVIHPHDTVERLRPILSQFGVTRVANVTGLDVIGIPTVMVVRPNARSLSVSQGKGLDLDAAKASGIMESLEQYAAEHIARPLVFTTLSELGRDRRPIDVDRLPGFLRPFGAADRILWIEGHDVLKGESRWIPYELVHLDFTLPLPSRSGFFQSGSNGLASGNHFLEAVVHGIYELIERDALTLFYTLSAEEQGSRRIDLSSVDDESCRALLALYDRADVDVGVWDVTSDLGIATFLAIVLDRVADPFRPMGAARGSGCHPDRGVALARALCEAAQSRVTRIAGTRDDILARDFEQVRSDASVTTTRSQLDASEGSGNFQQIASHAFDTFDEELPWICGVLDAHSIPEVAAVDLSFPDLPCSVVRVVIPGLESVSEAPGYRPGARARRRSSKP